MSNIAVAIDQLIKESKPPITGADIARFAGIQMAQISRIRNGRQIWVSPKDLYRIALALCKDPKSKKLPSVHARLLFARLQDEISGPGAVLIDLSLKDASTQKERSSTKPRPVLPPTIQADLDVIADVVENDKDIRDLVAGIANLCRHARLSQPDPK